MTKPPAVCAFEEDGIAVFPGIVADPASLEALRCLPEFANIGRPGSRGLEIAAPVARLIAPDGALTELANELSAAPARPVSILFFDKSADSNWAVPWHQDRTIAVQARLPTEGFDVWSVKAGIHHVKPPADILLGMTAIRLHLDNCNPDNGPLKAIRGSFRYGPVKAADTARRVQSGVEVVCTAAAGAVVAMRGLTLHASDRARTVAHRRVLHVDYATGELPGELKWALDWPLSAQSAAGPTSGRP